VGEALHPRVKDVEFRRREILVREGKGFKDRVTMLPKVVAAPLKAHLEKVRAFQEKGLAAGRGVASLDSVLTRLEIS
jgi:site-specific recombinase XerD